MQDTDQDILTILYTNDLHSHFGAMGRISAMVKEQRGQNEACTLLLDIGDHMDRAAPETEGTMGQANVDVLNLTGYDAITIGNNEGLTFTPELLNQAYAGLVCPVVCGNILEIGQGKPPVWMKEDLIVHKGPFTIGLVGATVAYADFYELLGLEALDPKTTIMKSVERLRPQVDLIVVMSHLGLPFDKELAEVVPDIDLIIGGHTHHLLEEPLYIGRTAITAAGKFGRYLGKFVFERDRELGKLVVREARCLPVEDGPEDHRILNAIAIHKEQAEIRMQRTVAVIEEDITIDYRSESPFGNLLAQAVRRYTDSDLSIVNSGQLLADLPAGEITEGMLHERCPSPINPCRMSLTGEDILYTLEQSLLPEESDRVIYGFGFRGKVLGGICVDGMEIIYNKVGLPYNKILQASVSGVPIARDKIYVVGTLDMFTFGIGYERLKCGRDKEFMLPDFLRDLLRIELQTPGAVANCFLSRWNKETKL
ncbi:bifunctional metallophosphatase/5'-nucleotidase [Paenibacillus anaericanus]|uniref:Bifunctional metallophosphatase/5'-nucleotidase n=1 Tax=Paenibacillus anaericanus TaxID=170367 RepID=A0A3S1DPS1_9BACL|nr:5'-nucleotidase C-terminal domain-containing protein [Paenibacillus anaericanus]RUT46244.1 bifunctional metallophosphatase/5'-nucleotidase [Paenibacillus anaericanus]